MSSGLWGIGFSIVQARVRKLLKRMVASPMRKRDYLLAQLFARLVFLAGEVSVLLAFGALALGMPVRGSLAAIAVLSIVLTAVLVAPALLFPLNAYPTAPGPNQMSLAAVAVWLWLPMALAAVAATAALARTRFAWLAGAFAMVAALPRLLDYEIGFLLVGLAERRPDPRQ